MAYTWGKEDFKTLSTSALFYECKNAQINTLLAELNVTCSIFPHGTIIVDEATVPAQMGLVLSGHLHVYDSAFKGERHLIRILGPGEIIGASLIAERQRSYPAMVSAFGTCRVATFPLANVRKLLRSPRGTTFRANFAYVVSEEIQANWRKIAILSCSGIEKRLMLYLRDRAQREGTKTLVIGSTEAEFADYLGVHRTALARVLRKLEKEGRFTYHRDVFTLQ